MKTVAQVAKKMGVHSNTVRKWCRAGMLGAYQVVPNGTWRIPDGYEAFCELHSSPMVAEEAK